MEKMLHNVWDSLPGNFSDISSRLTLKSGTPTPQSDFECLSKIFGVLALFPDTYVKVADKFLQDSVSCLTEILYDFDDLESSSAIEENELKMQQQRIEGNLSLVLKATNEVFQNLSSILKDTSFLHNVAEAQIFSSTEDLMMIILESLTKKHIYCLPKLLDSCKIYWDFLKAHCDAALSKMVVQMSYIAMCPYNFDRLAILRFVMQLSKDVGDNCSLVSIVVNLQKPESPQYISVVATAIQFANEQEMLQLSNKKEMFTPLRRFLKSTNIKHSKLSAFVLKSLTTFFAKIDDSSEWKSDEDSQLLRNLQKPAFVNYWTEFFNLYEVLEEKQIHIIRPYFSKLEDIRKITSEASIEWYFVILYKMLQHDNRGVAKEGAEKFIQYSNSVLEDANNSKEMKTRRIQFLEFIESSLLPILKDQVGWIFKTGDEFFRYVYQLGKTLAFIFSNENGQLGVTEKIMGFILQAEKGLGAHFLYFLVLTLDSAIKSIPVLKNSSAEKDLATFTSTMVNIDNAQILHPLEMIERYLNRSLTTIDTFMKTEIEKKLICIFSNLSNLKSNTAKRPKDIRETTLAFIGGLKKDVFCHEECFRVLKKVPLKQKDVNLGAESFHGLTANQIRGLLRWSLLSIINETDIHVRASLLHNFFNTCLEINDLKHWSPATVNATEDIFKCIELLRLTLGELQWRPISDALNNFGETKELWKRLQNILILTFVSGVSRKNFLNIVKEMHTIELFCSLSDKIKMPLVNESLKLVKPKYKFTFGSSNISDFVLCKLYVFFVDTCDEVLRNVLTTKIVGFEDYFLLGSVAGDQDFVNDGLYLEAFKENLSCSYYHLKYRLFTALAKKTLLGTSPIEMNCDTWKQYINVGLDTMDLSGQSGVIMAGPFFYECLNSVNDFESKEKEELVLLLGRFVEISWKHLDEQRKTENFWKSYKALVNYMTTSLSLTNTELFHNFVEKTFEYGETIMGMSLVMMEGIKKSWRRNFVALGLDLKLREQEQLNSNILNMCVSSACFGPTMVKTLKVDFSLWEYIIAENLQSDISGEILNTNHFNAASQTRLLAVMFIQMMLTSEQLLCDGKNNNCAELLLKNVVDQLLKINELVTTSRKRYFNNSSSHRLKQRIAQTLLVLQHLFSQDIRREVTEKLMDSLESDSTQPSVRYLLEWIIIRNLATDNKDWDIFFEKSISCSKAREGFGAFFATMCLHTTAILKDNESSKIFFEKSLRQLTDLLLGKHFTVKVYSLISFQKIYEIAQQRNWNSVIEPFKAIYDSLKNFTLTGNFTKIHQNIMKDFYVNIFHAETNYNYPVIFIHLPRIAEMATDEIIPEASLTALCNEFDKNFRYDSTTKPKLSCPSQLAKSYKEYQKDTWLYRAILDGRELGEVVPTEVEQLDTSNDQEPSTGNLQKKMNPWKFLPVADEISEFPEQIQLRKINSAEDGLIVVASLIDRAPNLGGLCRTCEIFGVSKYVISSMKVLDDVQFKNLSVSAQNWVGLLEVPVKDLEVFLISQAAKGYTIIGVEQATESTKLNSYKFPRKSLLLLGNEKSGIPTHLLHYLDQCLEIPQVGVVRSLNVHVTGALCIWEYASQLNNM